MRAARWGTLAFVTSLTVVALVTLVHVAASQPLDPAVAAALRDGAGDANTYRAAPYAMGDGSVDAGVPILWRPVFSSDPGGGKNSEPSLVAPGHMLPLRDAAVPYARYLHEVHNRIHPRFADGEMARFETMPGDASVNDMRLIVRIEMVIEPSGALAAARVVRSQDRAPEFERAALRAVNAAAPFPPTPVAIRSFDGRVYMHWEFWRNPTYACSTMNVTPYILDGLAPVVPIITNDGGAR
jgi:TonB family protein